MRQGWKACGCGVAAAMPWLIAVGLCLWLGSWAPSLAEAQPSQHVKLELSAPASCLDARSLLQGIDAQLGAEFSTDSTLQASVRVRVLGPADYELQLRYRAGSGAQDERRLRGESCRAISDAAALLLALALNPSVAPESAPTDGATAASPSQAVWAPRVGVTLALDSALVQGVGLGAGLLVGLRVGPLELGARGQVFLLPSSASAGTTTRWEAFSAEVNACVPWELARFTLGPCVRAEVGQLSAQTSGPIEEPRPGAGRFQALAVGAELRMRLASPFWLALTADFAWFLRRPGFVVADLGEVGRPAKFGMRVHLGPLLAW